MASAALSLDVRDLVVSGGRLVEKFRQVETPPGHSQGAVAPWHAARPWLPVLRVKSLQSFTPKRQFNFRRMTGASQVFFSALRSL